MNGRAKKVILFSKRGYSDKHGEILIRLINEKVLLFCAVGKDSELWHDVMDEFIVGDGQERDFFMITTWHQDETLDEVVEFAKNFEVETADNDQIKIIQI